MGDSVYILIAVVLILVLLLNVTLRVYVLKLYRRLVRDEVDFDPVHFFNEKRLAEEILPKYPEHEDEIRRFVRLVKLSMTMASIILVIILYLGYTLIKTQI